MTLKHWTSKTSSLPTLMVVITALLMACGGEVSDPTLCTGTAKINNVSIDGATIQAEDYQTATTGVERRKTTNGPCALRTTNSESSGEYALKIAQASDFDLSFTVNANAGTQLRLELDGNPMDNTTLNVTATASAFKEFSLPALTLPFGEHQLRVVIADLNGSSAVMIDSFKLTKPTTLQPYGGTPAAVPFILEAEHFDRGGTGLAYLDTTSGNSGSGARISNVDVEIQGGDQFVTNTQPGEYLKYAFTVPAALDNKNFRIAVRYAAEKGGGKFSLDLGGRKPIDKLTVVTSSTWREASVVVPIGPGTYEFVLYFDSLAAGATSVMNVDRLEVSVDSDVVINPAPPPPPGVIGQVSAVYELPYMPIHAALMPNGKVFSWGGGSEYNKDINITVWDPTLGDDVTARTNRRYTTSNLFCAGFSHLPDGRLLIAGGHWSNFIGIPDASIFDSAEPDIYQALKPSTPMYSVKRPNAVGDPRIDPTFNPDLYYQDPTHTGRWYPSTTPLANGEIMVSEGYSSKLNVVNNLPEVWQSNAGGGWRTLDTAKVTDTGALSYYPFMYPRPNNGGEVVRIGPEPTLYAFTTEGTGTWTKLIKRPDSIIRDYGSAAMFAPGRILLVGGNGGDGTGRTPLNSGVVVDINSNTPTFTDTPNMAYPRRHAQTTILPTGDVLITNGSSGIGHNAPPYVFPIELYSVGSNRFRTLANISRPRGYHSVALLLPDGRIMIGGGGNCAKCQPDQNNVEYYKPPYLFKSTGSGGQTEVTSRPEITSVTNTSGTPIDLNTSIGYGEKLKITANLADTGKPIARVTMIKLGAVTHARNFDQNFNELLGFTTSGSILTATVPSVAAWATPGHYMIFAIDTDGVPSIAKIIKLQ
jgi:Domain of unknown function (DUF1929)/Carbohydrate binding module (family 6)